MAERIVVLGHNKGNFKVDALELSVSDACAFRDQGALKVTLTRYATHGLENATVMNLTMDFVLARGRRGYDPSPSAFDRAWKDILAMPRHPKHEPYEIDFRGPRTGTVNSHELGEDWTAEHHLGVEPAA